MDSPFSLHHLLGLAPLPVGVPLLGAATLAALRPWLKRTGADLLALFFSGLTLAITFLLLVHSLGGNSVYWLGNWYPRGSMVLGIGLMVGPIGAGLATLASLLTFLALLFSWHYVEAGSNHMQPLMLIFLAAMCGFSLTADIFNLFVFFELMSIAAFALCGLKTAEAAPLQGSLNFAFTNTIAAFFILSGIGLLYAMTGALNIAQIGLALGPRHDQTVIFAFTLITCGFFIKAAIFPFHLWLPDAHAVAPTSVCVLFSGIMVELGLYAVLRLRYAIFGETFAFHAIALRNILFIFAAFTVVIGGLMCYTEHHLKRMLAYSTVCHAGLMLLAMSLGSPLAAAAMLVYLLAHAFVKSSLFFSSGIILHRLRSISEKDLFGKGKQMPFTAALWFLGGAGLSAAPCFGTMLGEAGASHAATLMDVHGIEVLFLIGGLFTGAAVFRIGMHTFFGWGDEPITDRAAQVGELPETSEADKRGKWYHFAPPIICIALAVLMTLFPAWIVTLRNAAANLTMQSAYLHTVYTGQATHFTQPGWSSEIPGAMLRGSLATLLALLLALTSVFRGKLRRPLRTGAFLEDGFRPLRAMQSGHPGDYTFWITTGIALFGSAAMLFLRR